MVVIHHSCFSDCKRVDLAKKKEKGFLSVVGVRSSAEQEYPASVSTRPLFPACSPGRNPAPQSQHLLVVFLPHSRSLGLLQLPEGGEFLSRWLVHLAQCEAPGTVICRSVVPSEAGDLQVEGPFVRSFFFDVAWPSSGGRPLAY